MPTNLITARLELVAADIVSARAAADSNLAEFSRLLNARIPPDWPHPIMVDAQEPLAKMLEEDPAKTGWLLWYIVLRAERVLIGGAGFKGPPTDGRIDIGYAILDDHQRKHYASEAVAALLDFAFADPRTERVIGETYSELTVSIRVMEKNGFQYLGKASQGHDGEQDVIQYELTRRRWQRQKPI